MPSPSRLLAALNALRGTCLVTFHSMGDADALASALALEELLAKTNPRLVVDVRSPDALSPHARRVARELGLPPVSLLAGLDYDSLVFVDVDTAQLLGARTSDLLKFGGRTLTIDHHAYNNALLQPDYAYLDAAKGSCAEIVYDLYRVAHLQPAPSIAALLVVGSMTDTAGFQTAAPSSFQLVADLLPLTRLPYARLLDLSRSRPDAAERLAVLQAVQTATIQKIQVKKNQFIVVGAATAKGFESAVVNALVELGCDYAFAGNPRSGRLSVCKRLGAKGPGAGALAQKAGRILGGAGGGHDAVGGASGNPALIGKALKACVDALR